MSATFFKEIDSWTKIETEETCSKVLIVGESGEFFVLFLKTFPKV